MGAKRRLIDDILDILLYLVFFCCAFLLAISICFTLSVNPLLGYFIVLVALVYLLVVTL